MKKIVHIYYNTSGNSGLYLNPIKTALEKSYDQKLFVNFYYPLDLGGFYKIFFEFTEKNENNRHKIIMRNAIVRKVIRLLELKKGNRVFFKELATYQPDVVNYSLTNMPDAFQVLSEIRKILPQAKIVVTCHDVTPFVETNGIDYQRIYDFADYLLVHTTNAIGILQDTYNISMDKIVYHSFPLIDLSLLSNGNEQNRELSVLPRFLFIGVMREEKGVQILIDAWKDLGADFRAELTIAGFRPNDVEIDYSEIEGFKNFKFIERSLSDNEYLELVERTDYVVFPYKKVGNSGVLSTVVSLRKVPVTTALPTFIESEYCFDELQCEPGSSDLLAEHLRKIVAEHSEKYQSYVEEIDEILRRSNNRFQKEVTDAYELIV